MRPRRVKAAPERPSLGIDSDKGRTLRSRPSADSVAPTARIHCNWSRGMPDRRADMYTSGRVAHNLSRRRFCLCCVASTTFAATGAWLSPSEVFAQARSAVDIIRSAAATAPITVHRLRGNVSVLEGSGGNIAVLPGPDGKLLVDAGITASRPRIKEALAGLGDQPVKHLINTHWHFDHADGNEWLNQEGATILAHENARKHLMSAQ